MTEAGQGDESVVRAFVAVELPASVQKGLVKVIEKLRRAGAHVGWTQPDNLHITLAFLGDVAAEQAARLEVLLDLLCAVTAPFDLECAELGTFGSPRSPRIIWAGVEDAPSCLGRLQASLVERLKTGGFRLEDRPFHAHVTIGRVRSGRGVRDLTSELGSVKNTRFGRFRVERLVLMRSLLGPGGPRYTVLHASPLKGADK